MDKTFKLQGIGFEWDEEKYAVNLRKHGVKFEEAAEVFFDRFNIYGDASVEEERREFVLGFSLSAKYYLWFMLSAEYGCELFRHVRQLRRKK